jgi:hypothetical protein
LFGTNRLKPINQLFVLIFYPVLGGLDCSFPSLLYLGMIKFHKISEAFMNKSVAYQKKSPRISLLLFLLLVCTVLNSEASDTMNPLTNQYDGRKGVHLYVSQLGNNTDGSSWANAFHSIQSALSALPDEKGGHVIAVRPDTYAEANLYPSFKGAAGSYNLLVGDTDGKLGSGTTGRIVIDASDPEKGFKSYDWWGTIRSTSKGWRPEYTEQTFSGIGWDRWILKGLYTSGGDAGFFWDLTDKSGEEFTVVVEDCVGIGRAFGGGICYPVVRPDEPSIFRRCYFLALDWVGDAAAVLVGGWETEMPSTPHLVLEDCTLVHPDNALAMSYAAGLSYSILRSPKWVENRRALSVLRGITPTGNCKLIWKIVSWPDTVSLPMARMERQPAIQ